MVVQKPLSTRFKHIVGDLGELLTHDYNFFLDILLQRFLFIFVSLQFSLFSTLLFSLLIKLPKALA